eukprot:224285-Rhodomonas_salina.2
MHIPFAGQDLSLGVLDEHVGAAFDEVVERDAILPVRQKAGCKSHDISTEHGGSVAHGARNWNLRWLVNSPVTKWYPPTDMFRLAGGLLG